MNKKIFVSVLIVVLVIVGIWYFVKQPINQNSQNSLEANSISSAYVYGPELNKVKVFLYAPDEKKTVVTDNYCGGKKGAEIRTGNYKLVVDSKTATSDNPGGNSDLNWKDSTLDTGHQMQFVQNTAWDGKLTVDQFDPIGYKNFIVIQQYQGCNGTGIYIYGYDLSTGKLVQYPFNHDKAGLPPTESIFVTSFKKSANGNLTTSTYNQTTGKTETTEWIFDSNKNNSNNGQFVTNNATNNPPDEQSNLKNTTVTSSLTGKIVTFYFSNNLTATKMKPWEDSSLIALLDNTNFLAMSIYEISSSRILEERGKFSNYSSLGLKYLGEQKYNGYTVKEFLSVGIPPNPNAKQKIWFVDFGNYGLTVSDDSEGKHFIDWSSFKVK